MRTCPVWSLHVVIKFVNANAVYLSDSVFCLCHSTLCAYTDVEHVHFRRVDPAFGTVFIGTVSVAWIKRVGQLAADDVASVLTLWVQSPLGPRQFVGFFVGYRRFPAATEKKTNRNIYVCMCACLYVYMHIRMPACLSPCTSRVRLLWYCPIFTVRRITSNTNMLCYMQKHTSQSKVIYKNMFVCLYGCLSQSLPCPPVCWYASVVFMWFLWLVGVLWALLCAWYLCAVHVKWNIKKLSMTRPTVG